MSTSWLQRATDLVRGRTVKAPEQEKLILRDEQARRDVFAAALAAASIPFPLKPEWSDCDPEPWSKP